MNAKNVLIGAGLLTIGYQVGKIVAYVRTAKAVINITEEFIPGFKESLVRRTSDSIIDAVFESKENEEGS